MVFISSEVPAKLMANLVLCRTIYCWLFRSKALPFVAVSQVKVRALGIYD